MKKFYNHVIARIALSRRSFGEGGAILGQSIQKRLDYPRICKVQIRGMTAVGWLCNGLAMTTLCMCAVLLLSSCSYLPDWMGAQDEKILEGKRLPHEN